MLIDTSQFIFSRGEIATYQYPLINTPMMRIFFDVLRCSFHNIGRGRSKIMKSIMTLEIALPSHHW